MIVYPMVTYFCEIFIELAIGKSVTQSPAKMIVLKVNNLSFVFC